MASDFLLVPWWMPLRRYTINRLPANALGGILCGAVVGGLGAFVKFAGAPYPVWTVMLWEAGIFAFLLLLWDMIFFVRLNRAAKRVGAPFRLLWEAVWVFGLCERIKETRGLDRTDWEELVLLMRGIPEAERDRRRQEIRRQRMGVEDY